MDEYKDGLNISSTWILPHETANFLLPQHVPGRPSFTLSTARFSAAMKLFRLLPAKWGRGLAIVGGEISLKAMAEADMELLNGEEPMLIL